VPSRRRNEGDGHNCAVEVVVGGGRGRRGLVELQMSSGSWPLREGMMALEDWLKRPWTVAWLRQQPRVAAEGGADRH
jgi:hypothetical protein